MAVPDVVTPAPTTQHGARRLSYGGFTFGFRVGWDHSSSAPTRYLDYGQRRREQSPLRQKGLIGCPPILCPPGSSSPCPYQLFPGHVCSCFGISRLGTSPKPDQACVLLPLLHHNAGMHTSNAWPLLNCKMRELCSFDRKIAARMLEHQCCACLNICSDQLHFPVCLSMRDFGGKGKKSALIKSHALV